MRVLQYLSERATLGYVGLAIATGVAARPMLVPAAEPDLIRVEVLVAQLGSPRYIDRQMATESLSSMGLEVVGPVRAALSSDDPEVRYRAEQILRAIRFDDRQRLINAFIAGADVSVEADLPSWVAFQEIAGATPEARSLYVEMLEAEWAFLESIHQAEPDDMSHLWMARSVALEAAHRETREKQDTPVGSVAALLLVAARDDVQLPTQANLMSLCYRSQAFNAALRAGPTREPLRRLMGKLIARDTGSPYLTQRFHFALQYDLKEALGPARQVLNDRVGIPHVRQYALLVVGKMGTDEDLALIENLLDDTALISSHNRVNNVRITTQVRDIALAILIHRHRDNFAAYDLPDFRLNSTTMIQTSSIGFASDEQREKAIVKWQMKNAAGSSDPAAPAAEGNEQTPAPPDPAAGGIGEISGE